MDEFDGAMKLLRRLCSGGAMAALGVSTGTLVIAFCSSMTVLVMLFLNLVLVR